VVSHLILTVTRQCNLRCTYCPTAKDGWPSLTPADARQAVRLFSEQYGGGFIKMFGGEPLLVPDVVRAAFEEARDRRDIRWVYLSTNGLGLNDEWLAFLADYPKAILTISMDGRPDDHRRHRRATSTDVPDTYDHIIDLLPRLLNTPRVVITQTIPPAGAQHMVDNFDHLQDLGFWRFNFLPGYYLPWRPHQLAHLQQGFAEIASKLQATWAVDGRAYVRNLFTWAPTPFFNTGMVVDSDRTIHPTNIGLSGTLDHVRDETTLGTLDDPPSADRLRTAARQTNGLLERTLAPNVWSSTLAVDQELSAFCRQLYPHWANWRKRRNAA
jgi:pyruvate-formate lyase-activating enzyme